MRVMLLKKRRFLKQVKKRLSIKSVLLLQVFLGTMMILKQLKTRLPVQSLSLH